MHKKKINNVQAIIIIIQVKNGGDARSYDLCINTSKVSVDDAVDLILKIQGKHEKF